MVPPAEKLELNMRVRAFVVMFNQMAASSEPEAIFFEWNKADNYIQSIRSEWDIQDGIEYTIHEKFIEI